MPAAPPPLALAVFEDRPERRALLRLAPGFRHCFCLLRQPDGWILCDPLRHRLHLELLPALRVKTLARHFRATGRRALIGPTGNAEPLRLDWLRPFTCVEAVKRALGVRASGVWTPRQLCRHLVRERKFLPAIEWAEDALTPS